MTGPDLIRRLHAHRQWANRRLRDAARPLDRDQLHAAFDIGPGSLLATLTHLHAAEAVWLATIQGDPNPPSPFTCRFDSLAELEPAWDQSEQDWSGWLARLTDADLDRPITKTATLTGQTSTTPLSDVLLHVCTHAQYTTAQAVNIMRRLGVPADELPDTMLISLSRAGG
ncbi:MAG: DinB family protein [Planctomycetota bacterium]